MNDKVKAPAAIPEGFEMISDGTLAKDHDFKKDPIVQGVIKSMKVVPVRRGKDLEDNRLMLVDTGTDSIAIWESANLAELFDDVVKGDTVYIHYTGDVDLENGLNPMKQFVTAFKPTGNRDAKQKA